MPRIEADSVAEHRAKQRDSLLDAAEQILLESGYHGLSFRTLGDRTGLARNSIYRYFDSRDEVIAELCERKMPQWLAELDAAMDAEPTVEGKAEAYIAAQLQMVESGRHRLAQVLAEAPLGPDVLARIHRFPDRASARLERALSDAGHPRAHMIAQLVTGILNAAFRLMGDNEHDPELVAKTIGLARRAVADD